jgi:hypothetical protein
LNLKVFFEEFNRKYALSTLSATFKTYRHWLREGFSEDHSMKNAITYGVAQVQSIVSSDSIQNSLHDFEMLATISQKMADVLRDRLESSARVEKTRVEASI